MFQQSLVYGVIASIFSFVLFTESTFAATYNRVDYSSPVYINGQLDHTEHLELFTRHADGELQDFWARVEITYTAQLDQEEKTDVFIKYFPVQRYRQITRKLRRIKGSWPQQVHDQVGLCDSNHREIRFKRKVQVIVDECGFKASTPKIRPPMSKAQSLLQTLLQETLHTPDITGSR